jgi:hypothetical protein
MMASKRGSAAAAGDEVGDLSNALDAQMPAFDVLRAKGLERLAAVREGRRAGLERERRRLQASAGEDDPRLAAIDSRIAHDRALAGAARFEAGRARTKAPEAGEAEWIVHGRVLDRRLEPLADLLVTVHSAGGDVVDAFGRACTDEAGAFQLAGVPDDAKQGVLHLRVHDGDGRLLHVDERPLVPRRQRADHVEVVLGEPPRPCPPEPTEAKRGDP